jgi:hypothetical protein
LRYAEDGSIVLEAQLLTEAGALFLKALAAGLPESSEPKPTGFKCHDVSAETSVPRVPIEKRRVDALV